MHGHMIVKYVWMFRAVNIVFLLKRQTVYLPRLLVLQYYAFKAEWLLYVPPILKLRNVISFFYILYVSHDFNNKHWLLS
jgi:hypothetical protein